MDDKPVEVENTPNNSAWGISHESGLDGNGRLAVFWDSYSKRQVFLNYYDTDGTLLFHKFIANAGSYSMVNGDGGIHFLDGNIMVTYPEERGYHYNATLVAPNGDRIGDIVSGGFRYDLTRVTGDKVFLYDSSRKIKPTTSAALKDSFGQVSYDSVKTIFEINCSPCHSEGGNRSLLFNWEVESNGTFGVKDVFQKVLSVINNRDTSKTYHPRLPDDQQALIRGWFMTDVE